MIGFSYKVKKSRLLFTEDEIQSRVTTSIHSHLTMQASVGVSNAIPYAYVPTEVYTYLTFILQHLPL